MREVALARLSAVDPTAYARTRNHLEGAVTGLSPYLTHGLISVPECVQALALPPQHKLTYEFGWREYFRHVWSHRGDGIFDSIHAGPRPDTSYARTLPEDIRQAATEVPVIDQAVRELYATGLLHNHARMWLASYLVHLRKVHWRVGADWLYGHLLDGDLASNHLSWQWVAGTGSHKPYLFDAANVARFAPRTWHSWGSAIDLSRDMLDAVAASPDALPAGSGKVRGRGLGQPVTEPAVFHTPRGWPVPDKPAPGADVWLAHPWALGEPPAGATVIGVAIQEAHADWAWSAQRWAWVEQRMRQLTDRLWFGTAQELATALQGAARVRTVGNPHIDRWLPPGAEVAPEPLHFRKVDTLCGSFSKWWSRVSE